MNAERRIEIQPATGSMGLGGHVTDLRVCDPLRVEMISNGDPVRVRVAKRLWPETRRPHRHRLPQSLSGRPKDRVVGGDGVSVPPPLELGVSRSTSPVQRLGQQLQHLSLRRHHPAVVDKGRGLQRGNLFSKDRRLDEAPRTAAVSEFRRFTRVDEDLVPEEPTHGEVGAWFERRIAEKARQQRERRDDLAAYGLLPPDQSFQIREVADAPASRRVKGVKRHEAPPGR